MCLVDGRGTGQWHQHRRGVYRDLHYKHAEAGEKMPEGQVSGISLN